MAHEIEVPLEQAHEHIHHHAAHSNQSWVGLVALSSAVFAVLAAVAALSAGANSNEAVLDQIHAADKWAYFQAKGLKGDVLDSKMELLQSLDKPVSDADVDRRARLEKERDKAMAEAHAMEADSRQHLHIHELLACCVTFFQITIAVGAVSVLSKRKQFFYVSLCFALIGLGFFTWGFSAMFL